MKRKIRQKNSRIDFVCSVLIDFLGILNMSKPHSELVLISLLFSGYQRGPLVHFSQFFGRENMVTDIIIIIIIIIIMIMIMIMIIQQDCVRVSLNHVEENATVKCCCPDPSHSHPSGMCLT